MTGQTSPRLHCRDDDLARQAKRAMAKWKMTLGERTRAELREPTLRERVQIEIEKERSRRTVRKTVATGSNSALPRGSLIVRTAVRTAGAGGTAGISTVASGCQLDGRDRLRPSTSRPKATVGCEEH
jgi:hypothetical protein